MSNEPVTCLGLDFGGKFGYAVGRANKIIECGTLELAKRAKQLRKEPETALDHMLREIITRYDVGAISWENSVAAFSGSMRGVRKKAPSEDERGFDLGPAMIKHARYEGIVIVLSDKKNLIKVPPIHNTSLKKFATGNHKAKKDLMIAWANRLYGLNLGDDDDNTADACHVCAHVMQKYRTVAPPF